MTLKSTISILLTLTCFLTYSQDLSFELKDFNHKISSQVKIIDPLKTIKSSPFAGDLDPELEAQLQAIVDSCRSTTNAAGISAALITPDGNWAGTNGMASMDVPVKPSDIFGVGSVSKILTAAAIFKLQDDEQLNINDEVSDWIPSIMDYEFIDPSINIYNLLQHTSGIFNYTEHPNFADSIYSSDFTRVWTPIEILEDFLAEPLFTNGQSWSYSNTNYILLGLIIEAASGQSYHQYIRDQLLSPNDLDGIALFPYENITSDYAHIFIDLDNDGNVDDIDAAGIDYQSIFSSAWAAGAYTSSAEDIATFARLLYSGKLLSEEAMMDMYGQYPLNNQVSYGMGVIIVNDEEGNSILYGHNGAIFYSSNVFYFPAKDIAVSLLANSGNVNADITYPYMLDIIEACINFVPTSDKNVPIQINEINLYPNPTSDYLNIEYTLIKKSEVEIHVIDQMGKIIETISSAKNQAMGKQSIEWKGVNALAAGLYYLDFKVEGKKSYSKIFIKE